MPLTACYYRRTVGTVAHQLRALTRLPAEDNSIPSPRPCCGREDLNTALYRAWNQAGELLYVGIAKEGASRWRGHAAQSDFYPHVAHLTIEWCATRAEARARERRAIEIEHPLWNVVYNGRRGMSESRSLRCDRCGCWYAEDPRFLWCGDIPFSPPRLVGSRCHDQSGPLARGLLPPPCGGVLVAV